MKKHTEQLEPDTYYHIYNRGINGTRIFTKKGNTDYFLEKYIKYILPIADTYAFVLMGNHFHFLIKTKSDEEILEFYQNIDVSLNSSNADRVSNPVSVNNEKTSIVDKSASFIISKQFSHFFNSYTQSINKQDQRTGGLFETPFRRIEIETMDYLAHLVYYIHNNPVKHGFTDNFSQYQHSSYTLFLNNIPTFIKRNEVFEWFGGKEPFLIYHGQKHDFDKKWYENNWIEID